GTNWSTGIPPNGGAATALLGSAITADRTVLLDIPVTLATLHLDNANAYTVDPLSEALDTLSLSSIVVTNLNGNGAHRVSASVTISNSPFLDISVQNTSAAGLTLAEVKGNGDLVKTGDGTLRLTSVATYVGNTSVRGGTLAVAHPNALPFGTNVA